MRRFCCFVAATALALGPIACAADGPDPESEDSAAEEAELRAAKPITEADNGKTIEVTVGQSFSIQLASNPSTGYQWIVRSVDRTLGQPKESFKSSDGAVGSGGKQRFRWSTKSPLNLEGRHTIELAYQRSWETADSAKTFSVTVNIRSAANGPGNSPLPPTFCSDGRIETEAAYIASSDEKECSMPRVHCVTNDANACPMRSPLSPDFCKDGTIETEASFIASSDGKECSMPRVHCVTKKWNACPMLSPLSPHFCKDGTIERGRGYIASADGKECSMPRVHCLTKDMNACPMR